MACDDGLRCPECGSDIIYKERFVVPGTPPYVCDDCGYEGEESDFKEAGRDG